MYLIIYTKMNRKKNIIKEYKKLLEIGKLQIKREFDNDLDEHSETDKLLKLNDYVYTYYSTNKGDDTYSIEFVVLADHMNIILEELDKKGMWYCAKNYKTEKYVEKYDKELNDFTKKKTINIRENDLRFYNAKTENNPYGWEIDEIHGDIITISKEHKIHFLESDMINDFNKMYNDSNYFLNMTYIQQLTHIDINLLSKNIAVIVVEDPVIESRTLYDELLKIFEEKINLEKNTTPLTKKSRSPLKEKRYRTKSSLRSRVKRKRMSRVK